MLRFIYLYLSTNICLVCLNGYWSKTVSATPSEITDQPSNGSVIASKTIENTTTTFDPINLQTTVSIETAHRLFTSALPIKNEQRIMVAIPVEIDLKQVIGFDCGELYAQGLFVKEDDNFQAGQPMVNDYHAYSNLQAEDRVQLYELYWSKTWRQTTIRVGKLDGNDHFAVSEHESQLINGAAGYSPSIFGMPSYPDSAWSIQVAHDFDHIEASIGVFDGSSTTLDPLPTGAKFGFSQGVGAGDLFWITQLTLHLGKLDTELDSDKARLLTPQQDRDFRSKSPFHLTIGLWTHQGKVVPSVENQALKNHSSKDVQGETSEGIFMTSDLKLLSLPRGGELGLGVQAALSPHYYPLHVSTAVTWSEALPPLAWAQSGLSLALGLSHLSIAEHWTDLDTHTSRYEHLFELTANLPITPSLATSLSWMTISGQHLQEDYAHLLIARLLLGVL